MDGITTSINAILKNLIKGFNSLLDCPARFSGEYGGDKVHRFIEYIEYYKQIKCIADKQALEELQYLLMDHGYDWWLRRKVNITTWSEALALLENQYSKKRPAYAVYTEILKHTYEDYESKDDFVDDKIELFYELSEPELSEKNKLDIIYALLPSDEQNKFKLLNINNIKELKEQFKLAKLNTVHTARNAPLESQSVEEANIIVSEVGIKNKSSNKTICQENDNQSSVVHISSENDIDSERDSIIKVRRTKDLMPQDIKEEESTPKQQEEEFLSNAENSATNNLQSSQDDFEIDNDIMNQINNIIDESEMNMREISNSQVPSTTSEQLSNSVISLELLGFHIEASKKPNKTTDNQCGSQIKTIKKLKKRCTYCRRFNHSSQFCLKRAKHMEKFTQKSMETKEVLNDNIPKPNINNDIEDLAINASNCNVLPPLTDRLLAIPLLLNQIPTTSTPLTDTLTAVTTPTAVSNNSAEKHINHILTTKLIAPINGKTTNKTLASKLRGINTPSPKCHQCGTLGFYKSICPNCSPIYNNNNHNQYNK